MHSLPSPAESPAATPKEPSPALDSAATSRKRARSTTSSSNASSSKRALSEDPSPHDPTQGTRSSSQSPPVPRSADSDIDAYMADQPVHQATQMPPAQSAQSASQASAMTGTQKHEFVLAERKKPMTLNAKWYIVAHGWYRRWEKACTGIIDKEGPVDESQLGPVDNSSLVDSEGNLNVGSLIEGHDVEYVPETVWAFFEKNYGRAKYPLPRKVISRGLSRELVLEIHPLSLKVLRLVPADNSTTITDTEEVKQVTVSSQELLGVFYTILVQKAQVQSFDFRIWKLDCDVLRGVEYPSGKLLQEGGTRLPYLGDLSTASTVESALIESGDVFVVERRIDMRWIVDEHRVPTPGATSAMIGPLLPSADSSLAPLFQPGSDFFSRMTPSSSSSSSTKASPSTALTTTNNLIAKKNTIVIPGGKARDRSRIPGIMGLGNMGNTCFMNSALQCLAHTRELIDYFLTGVYREELNPDNPLGMQGAIAEAFGALLDRLWSTSSAASSYSPRQFKMQLQRFAPQFSGYQQHDSQELVAFLLDGLHEDLNRVKKKPYVEKPDWNGGGDKELVELAQESWNGYKKRNDSVIVDLFQGQYQSTLVCPECQKVSITFDPFMYLTLPLPIQKKWRHTIFYVPWELDKPHVKIPVEISRNASFKDLRKLLGRWMDADPDNLLTLEVFSHKFYKNLDDNVPVSDMAETDIIVCYELPCHAQQSRTWKPDENLERNPLIVPVYLGKDTPQRAGFGRMGTTGFAHPFVIALTHEQACDQTQIYEVIVDRLQRWALRPDDLFQWEQDIVSDSPSSQSMRSSALESNVSVSVQEVHETEEGDIADEPLETQDSYQEMAVDDTELVKTGCKQDLFQMRIQSGHEKYGTGHAWSANANWTDCQSRQSLDKTVPIVREGDILSCEWDDNLRIFYFGDEHSAERPIWDPAGWDEFVHPELKDSQSSANVKKKRGITLQDCLDEFTKEEQLGEDDLWYCPSCKKHQQATKRFDLWKVPDILVVHLKRFSNSRALRDKIDVLVDFPIEGLDLEPLVGERKIAQRLAGQGADLATLGMSDLDEQLVYDLYAVDEHLGGLGGGHYRAYAHHHEQNKWYHFDDSYVTPAQATESVNPNAYLLFYKRRSSKPIGGKTYEIVEAARKRALQEEADAAQLPTPPEEQEPRYPPGLTHPSPQGSTDLWPPQSSDGLSPSSSSNLTADEQIDEDPPDFEESQYDPLVLDSETRTPLGSITTGKPSPSSSNEVEPDLDRASDFDGEPTSWAAPDFQWSDGTTAYENVGLSSETTPFDIEPAAGWNTRGIHDQYDTKVVEVNPFGDDPLDDL